MCLAWGLLLAVALDGPLSASCSWFQCDAMLGVIGALCLLSSYADPAPALEQAACPASVLGE